MNRKKIILVIILTRNKFYKFDYIIKNKIGFTKIKIISFTIALFLIIYLYFISLINIDIFYKINR